jgi:hypothetical protein
MDSRQKLQNTTANLFFSQILETGCMTQDSSSNSRDWSSFSVGLKQIAKYITTSEAIKEISNGSRI